MKSHSRKSKPGSKMLRCGSGTGIAEYLNGQGSYARHKLKRDADLPGGQQVLLVHPRMDGIRSGLSTTDSGHNEPKRRAGEQGRGSRGSGTLDGGHWALQWTLDTGQGRRRGPSGCDLWHWQVQLCFLSGVSSALVQGASVPGLVAPVMGFRVSASHQHPHQHHGRLWRGGRVRSISTSTTQSG